MLVSRTLTSGSSGIRPAHLLSGLRTFIVRHPLIFFIDDLSEGHPWSFVASTSSATSSRPSVRLWCRMGCTLLHELGTGLWSTTSSSAKILSNKIWWPVTSNHLATLLPCRLPPAPLIFLFLFVLLVGVIARFHLLFLASLIASPLCKFHCILQT